MFTETRSKGVLEYLPKTHFFLPDMLLVLSCNNKYLIIINRY